MHFYGRIDNMVIQQTHFGAQRALRYSLNEGRYCYGNEIHQFSEFVFVLDGELEMTVEGKTEIGRKNDCFLITPFKVHSFETKEYSKIFIYVFSNDFATSLIGEQELYRGRDSALFTPSEDVRRYVENRIYDASEGLIHSSDPEKYYMDVTCCIHLLIAEYTKQTTLTNNSKKSNALSSIFLYISQHFQEKITLDSVSHALGYTKGHISHCLEAIPNFNFNDLVNSLRVERAKTLMLSNRYRNIDVAIESGFSSERSFHRAFKKLTGLTPGEYLKKKKAAK